MFIEELYSDKNFIKYSFCTLRHKLSIFLLCGRAEELCFNAEKLQSVKSCRYGWKLSLCFCVFCLPGGKDYSVPKSYISNCLTYFLLKSMKRISDDRIEQQISPEWMSFRQHAYVKSKSVETALHEVVGTIKKAFNKREWGNVGSAFRNINIFYIYINAGVLDLVNCLV